MHVLQLVAKLIERGGGLSFGNGGVSAHAMANPIGIALHVAGDVLLLNFAEGIAHAGSGLPLRGHQIAHGTLHVLLKLLQLGEFGILLARQAFGLIAWEDTAVLRTIGAAHLAFEFLLLLGELIGLLGQFLDLVAGLAAAHALQALQRFLQALGGPARFSITLLGTRLLSRRCLAHVLQRLGELVNGLLQLLGVGVAQARILIALLLLHLLLGGLLTLLLALLLLAGLLTRLPLLTRLLARLPLLPLLPRLPLLTLLAGLSLLALLLLPGLRLLTVAAQLGILLHLLHLLLKLFGFTAQHLLLVALL